MKQFNTEYRVFMLNHKGISFGEMVEMEKEVLNLIISREINSVDNRFECLTNYKGAGFIIRDTEKNRFYQCFIHIESTPKDPAKLRYIWKLNDMKVRNIINRINGIRRFS